MQICPSILEYKTEDYFTTIKKLSPYYNYFQLDFVDGIYVNNKTASLDDFINELVSDHFMNFITLQTLKTLVFDFHLMVKDYENEIKKLERLGDLIKIKNVFIHYDLFPNYSLFNISLVLNPQDQITDLTSHYSLNSIPYIQIMSVVPGVQGGAFIPETLNKIEQLRLLGYRNKIFLDGAVNEKTMPIINSLKYKPDIICPGSYLAKSPDEELKHRIDYLQKMSS